MSTPTTTDDGTSDVINEINDVTNHTASAVEVIATAIRSIDDRLAALQGAITSNNQQAVRQAMTELAPSLGQLRANSDKLDQVTTALRALGADPANPASTGGVDVTNLASGTTPAPTPSTPPDSGSTASPPASGSDTSTPAPGTEPTADTTTGSTGGTVAPEGTVPIADGQTGAAAQPDAVTGPSDTAVGGAADATTGTVAGVPTGGMVDTSGAGGGVGTTTDADTASTPPASPAP